MLTMLRFLQIVYAYHHELLHAFFFFLIKRIQINIIEWCRDVVPAGKRVEVVPRWDLVPNVQLGQLIVEAVLQLLGLEHAKSGIGAGQHVAIIVGTRPYHVQLQVALGPAGQVDGVAGHLGQGAALGGLVDFRQLSVEPIGVLRTGVGVAKDAGIIERYAGDDPLLHVDNCRQEGVDKTQILVVIPTEETQAVRGKGCIDVY